MACRLALAGDYVVAREDIVLNPYYQHMGGLYGSEYWTYLLPRRVGPRIAARLTSAPFTPLGARHAARIGLLDACVRRHPRRLSRPDNDRGRTAGQRAGSAAAARTQTPPATNTTSAPNRSMSTAGKSWPARTNASSAPTPAITRRGVGSSTNSAPRPRGITRRGGRPKEHGARHAPSATRRKHPHATCFGEPARNPDRLTCGRAPASGDPTLRAARDRMARARSAQRSAGRA